MKQNVDVYLGSLPPRIRGSAVRLGARLLFSPGTLRRAEFDREAEEPRFARALQHSRLVKQNLCILQYRSFFSFNEISEILIGLVGI
jgi:hypothetical protein